MIANKPKNIVSRILANQKFIAITGLALIVLISFPLAKNISRRYKINLEVKELENEIADLESKNIKLDDLISYLKSDQFAEGQARLNLGLKKPGESVAIIESSPSGSSADQQDAAADNIFNIPGLKRMPPTQPAGNPAKWWKYFFSNYDKKY